MPIIRFIAIVALICLGATSVQADQSLWKKLYEPGHFAIMRHAEAPGTGDPGNFSIGDCTTQRNLSQSGRMQSKAIGDRARTGGINNAKVYTSQWCRCIDTAELLNIGDVQELPALNSFYQRHQDKDKNLAALHTFLEGNLGRTSPTILVTHQVSISALTDRYTRQGEIIVFKYLGGKSLEIIGNIPPK